MDKKMSEYFSDSKKTVKAMEEKTDEGKKFKPSPNPEKFKQQTGGK